TEAAAAEMASRLAERLAEFARHGEIEERWLDTTLLPGEIDRGELSARARALLGSLERLTVSTVHAFCNLLLRRHALALGLDPAFRIDARETLVEDVSREVVERATRDAYAREEESPLLELAANGIGPRRVVEALTRFTAEGTPAAVLSESTFSDEEVGRLVSELRRDISELLDVAGETFRAIGRSDLPRRIAVALEATLELLDSLPENSLSATTALSRGLGELWEKTLLERVGNWQRSKFLVSEGNAFGEDSARISELAGRLSHIDHLTKVDPVRLELARRALAPLLEEVQEQLQVRGIATFQDLLVLTRQLLTDSRVRSIERRRIRQLLVDEFQDTDEIQCDIVRYLSLDGATNERPGLFVVGDPKQSIYAWRNADLAAYEGFVQRALKEGGERFALVRNFRSAPAILAEVDRAIAPVMREEAGTQPPFEPLLPGKPADDIKGRGDGNRSSVEYWLSWDRDLLTSRQTPGGRATEIEAHAIAEDILSLRREQNLPWNEFALLFRATTNLDDYLETFRAAGIPFVVTSDKQYYRRREVIEAAALVRAIVQPVDHVALLTFLRSVAVGVPDAALIPLWRQGLPGLLTELQGPDETDSLRKIDAAIESAVEQTPDDVPGLDRVAGWDISLRAAVRSLATLRHSMRTEPIDRFVERLRTTLLIEALEAARYLGAYRVANLERFFRRLEEALAEGHGEIQSVLRALRRSVTQAREDEEALPKEAAENAVQIMTIHKAKGLEFGHVYVVQLHSRGRQSEHGENDADRREPESGPRQYVLLKSPSLRWDRVENERVRIAAAEQVRTLYVAMTRAERRLVLVGNWSLKPTPPSGVGVPAHLKLLAHRAPFPAGMRQLATEIEDPKVGFKDPHGATWKIPHLAAVDGDSEPPFETPLELPSAATIRAWSRDLAALGSEAKTRMERTLVSAASALSEKNLDGVSEKDAEDADSASVAGDDESARGLSRPVLQTIGRVIHQALENWDFGNDMNSEWERQNGWAEEELGRKLEGEMRDPAQRFSRELLTRMRAGKLLPRLTGSASQILARELPLVAPPRIDSDGDGDAAGPIAAVTGTIDLLLRDKDGEFLIVDFKTDELETADELGSRAEIYRSQLEAYRDAVQSAFALGTPPRAELWFLWADRAWILD
ncbi:MAG: UvrD-helicase domain-containing protein, partial [Acidobacteriota bacterium]|nr:UvrD-helicase domain-containing protein [Acidobacteriota bacterium]